MSDDQSKKYQGPAHQGPDHASPYPVSRLAPATQLVDLAKQIDQADAMLNTRVSAKLQVIADQVRVLQAEARSILEQTQRDQDLHRVQCNFKRQPGRIYHLYRRADDSRYFSMLSPAEWRGEPPHEFLGSYRLEADMSWTPAEAIDEPDDTQMLVQRLLEQKGLV